MAASITFYNSFRKYVADGTIDLDTDVFHVTLHTSTYTPSVTTHTVYADLTNELSTANGYTNDSGGAGKVLASPTWTQSTSTLTFDATDTSWTASGGSLVSRYAVISKYSTTANGIVRPLVAYILMNTAPADITVTDTNSLTLQWNASGIFTLT